MTYELGIDKIVLQTGSHIDVHDFEQKMKDKNHINFRKGIVQYEVHFYRDSIFIHDRSQVVIEKNTVFYWDDTQKKAKVPIGIVAKFVRCVIKPSAVSDIPFELMVLKEDY